MDFVYLEIQRDDTPKTPEELVEYLQTMACVHPDRGTRRMPTAPDDKVFDMAATEIIRLRKMVKAAYNDGFMQGTREHSSSRGGTPWGESNYRLAIAELSA